MRWPGESRGGGMDAMDTMERHGQMEFLRPSLPLVHRVHIVHIVHNFLRVNCPPDRK